MSPGGVDSGAQRIERFRKRYAWNEWTHLRELFEMPQRSFEGRHYDQTASLMRFLMDPRVPARRAAMLDLVRRLLSGRLSDTALERAVGMSTDQLEAAWLQTAGR